MYRDVHYNPFEEAVYVRGWDSDGNRIDFSKSFEPYIFLEHKDGKHKSIFNTPLTKKSFRNTFDRKKYVEGSGIKRIFENLSAEQQFILNSYPPIPEKDTPPLRIAYLDIETYYKFYSPYYKVKVEGDILVNARELWRYEKCWDEESEEWVPPMNSCYQKSAFPDPYSAKFPISVITVYDSLDDWTYTWGLKEPFTPKGERQTYYQCESEVELLQKFLKYWRKDFPDVVSGWNLGGYDLPYIVNRGKQLFDEDWPKKLSPYGNVRWRTFMDKNGNDSVAWEVAGVAVLDYMEVYKTFSMGDRENWSLAYISQYELGESKHAIKTSDLVSMADRYWDEYVEYNIQDVHLLPRLEEKLRYLARVALLAYRGACNFQRALGKVSVITGALAHQARKRGEIIPTFERDINSLDLTLSGGFVKEPEKKRHTAIVSFDVNSLYPNTIITLNLSPETKLGKIVDGDINLKHDEDSVTVSFVNGKTHTIKAGDFKEFLRAEKIALSKSGVLYTQKKKGIMPEFVSDLYADRVQLKKRMGQLKKKKSRTVEEEKELIRCDSMQHTIKILLNSLYGAQANKFFKMVDIDNASSITMTGQQVAKNGARILDSYIEETYGVEIPSTIYSDTDSVRSDTIIKTNKGDITIENLFKSCAKKLPVVITPNGHEVVDISKTKVQVMSIDKTWDPEFRTPLYITRHKVTKGAWSLNVAGNEVVLTDDHCCVEVQLRKLARVKAHKAQDAEMLYVEDDATYIRHADIKEVKGFKNEYVYDIDMGPKGPRMFFANNILVHNSCYITIQPVLEKKGIELYDEELTVTPEAHKIVNDIEEAVNKGITKWAEQDLYSTNSALVFKREAIARAGAFSTKKRYILNVLDDEGTPCNKFKYVGVEIVRTTTPEKVKQLMIQVVEDAIITYDRLHANTIYFKCFDEYKTLTPDEIAERVRVNNLRKWTQEDTISDFHQFIKGTPGHVKAAMTYNIMLKKLGIDGKYESIKSGQKIMIVPVKKNKYGFERIGFLHSVPPEFQLEVDYEASFKKMVEKPLGVVYNVLGWQITEVGKQVQTELFDFFS